VHDPDSPTPGGFTHWVLWNINPATGVIKEESVPPGSVEGVNGAGRIGYMGPCPGSGTHRYEFRLYALRRTLGLAGGSSMKELEEAIAPNLLAEALLVGSYKKS